MSHSAPADAPLISLTSNVRKVRFALSTSPSTRASSPRTAKYPTEILNVCCASAGRASPNSPPYSNARPNRNFRNIVLTSQRYGFEQRRCHTKKNHEDHDDRLA